MSRIVLTHLDRLSLSLPLLYTSSRSRSKVFRFPSVLYYIFTYKYTTTTIITFSESIQRNGNGDREEEKKLKESLELFWSPFGLLFFRVFLTAMIFPVACKVALQKLLILESNFILDLDSVFRLLPTWSSRTL